MAVEDARRRQRPPPPQALQGEDARRESGWALMRWLLETGVFGCVTLPCCVTQMKK